MVKYKRVTIRNLEANYYLAFAEILHTATISILIKHGITVVDLDAKIKRQLQCEMMKLLDTHALKSPGNLTPKHPSK